MQEVMVHILKQTHFETSFKLQTAAP